MPDALLPAEVRTERGSRPAGRLRREGRLPAVVYGLGQDVISVTVAAKQLGGILHSRTGANTLITLQIDGSDQLALARQVQRDPVKGTYLHVDFVRVRADQTIQADVPVHLTGDAEGVGRGGVLEQFLYTVSVEAKPADVPNSLEIDISALEIGDAAHVRDLSVPSGVVIMNDADDVLAQISAPRVVEEEVAAVEGEAAEGEGAPGAEGAGDEGGGESAGGE